MYEDSIRMGKRKADTLRYWERKRGETYTHKPEITSYAAGMKPSMLVTGTMERQEVEIARSDVFVKLCLV